MIPQLSAGVLGALLEMREIEHRVENGATVDEATQPVRAARFAGRPANQLPAPVRLGAALEAAVARATSADMARKIEATGRLMTEFFGDALLNAVFTETAFVHFMLWLMRLPASHGKAHGRNRYESVGRSLTKREEIDAADAADAGVRAEIEAMDLILAEKRALLTRRLVPRLSDAQIAKHHSRSKPIHEAARKVLGWAAGPWTSYLQEWRDEARRQQAQCQDPLALRRVRNKDRSAWSEERIGRLLSSTIFRGCFSSARRWRSGPLIVRDHTYWAPLVILHCAMRPEEVLGLLKANIAWRDGILGFVVEERADAGTKTASAVRVVPIPDILLRLGFLEWWHDRCREPGPLLFSEATRSETDGRASGTWGKRRRTLYRHLGIDDWREDGYAMRHTALTPPAAGRRARQRPRGHCRPRARQRHQPPLHRDQPRAAQALPRPDRLRHRGR